MKTKRQTQRKTNNCKIDPVLYDFFLYLRRTVEVAIVHRRKRKSSTCIEIVFLSTAIKRYTCRLNTLKEAEQCGFWVISRAQRGKHAFYHGHQVFQLYLSPVHPKKRREQAASLGALHDNAALAPSVSLSDVTFEPILFGRRLHTFAHRRRAFNRVLHPI